MITERELHTIQTENYGVVRYWREAGVTAVWDVWAAEGTDNTGGKHYGYSESPAKAVTDLFRVMPTVHLEVGEPSSSVAYREGGMNAPVQYLGTPNESRAFGGQTVYQAKPELRDTFTVEPPLPVYASLPAAFWDEVRADRKIMAIKELRDVTRLTLVSAKQLVDYIIPASKNGFTADGAIPGTVIRIWGKISGLRRQGYVFEKEKTGSWIVTGVETEYEDREVQDAMDDHGFDILYIPREH